MFLSYYNWISGPLAQAACFFPIFFLKLLLKRLFFGHPLNVKMSQEECTRYKSLIPEYCPAQSLLPTSPVPSDILQIPDTCTGICTRIITENLRVQQKFYASNYHHLWKLKVAVMDPVIFKISAIVQLSSSMYSASFSRYSI